MIGFLRDRFFRPRASHLHVTVYSRAGCHGCSLALEELKRQRRRHGFVLTVVNVDDDPKLVVRHGDWVPVVAIDGRLRFRGTLNRVLLERLLDAEARRPCDPT